jgi:hypothetical protein
MRKNTTESLRQIAAAMGPAEIEATSAFIAGFNRKYGEYEPKTLKLFSYISDNTKLKNLSDEGVKNHLFPDMDEGTFSKLVARLKEKVFESLQLEVNLSRGKAYAPTWLSRQRAKKTLISAEILSIKGLKTESDELLQRVLRDSQKYELYDLAGSACRILYIHLCTQLSSEKGEAMLQQAENYSRLACLERQAELLFYKYGFQKENPYRGEQPYRQLAAEIKRLSSELQGRSARGIEYLISQLKILYWEGVGSFENQAAEAQALRTLLSATPGISSPIRRVNAALQSMTAAMHLRQFQQAKQHIDEARSLSSLTSYSGRKVATAQAIAYIQIGHYAEANGFLQELLNQPQLQNSEREHVQYLLAYLDFMMGHAHKAKAGLKSLSLLRRQKLQDWSLGIEVFELQLRIDMGQFDVAEGLISNLQRRIQRQGEKEKPSQRLFTLVRLLHALSMESFQFKTFWAKNPDALEMLQDSRLGYRWDPFGHEVVPFENWLSSHAGIPLDASLLCALPQQDWIEVEL